MTRIKEGREKCSVSHGKSPGEGPEGEENSIFQKYHLEWPKMGGNSQAAKIQNCLLKIKEFNRTRQKEKKEYLILWGLFKRHDWMNYH